MHQRRAASSHQEHVQVVTTALLLRWWTVKDLAHELGVSLTLVKFTLQAIGRQRYVFKRRTTLKCRPREYRLFLEAHQVRRA